jgi:hypothetical protein
LLRILFQTPAETTPVMNERFPHTSRHGLAKGILCVLGACLHASVSAQDAKPSNAPNVDSFDINKTSFILPRPLPKHKYLHAFGLNYVVVPKDWTLDIIRAPMFFYEGKYALSHGFTLQGSLSTLFISTRVNLGPFWNYQSGPYHLGLGYQVAFNFGVLNQFGFKTRLIIWEQQPSITLGYSFSKTALVLRGDLYWTSSIYEYQGGHDIPHTNSFINGYGIGAQFEQRLWANRLMFLGGKMNYLRYHIIAWPAFPVNQYRYWVPEIIIGLVF